jgi:hypothetical protein
MRMLRPTNMMRKENEYVDTLQFQTDVDWCHVRCRSLFSNMTYTRESKQSNTTAPFIPQDTISRQRWAHVASSASQVLN